MLIKIETLWSLKTNICTLVKEQKMSSELQLLYVFKNNPLISILVIFWEWGTNLSV